MMHAVAELLGHRQLHDDALAAGPRPAIALDAADEPLAVMVDLDQRAMAVGAPAIRGRAFQLPPSLMRFLASGSLRRVRFRPEL